MARSPAILAIPGTGSVAHAENNVAAATIALTSEEVATLTRSGALHGHPHGTAANEKRARVRGPVS